MVVVAVVSGVVGQVMLDTRARRARVATAEGNAFHQVFAFHVALDTAKKLQRLNCQTDILSMLTGTYSLLWAFKISEGAGLETYPY